MVILLRMNLSKIYLYTYSLLVICFFTNIKIDFLCHLFSELFFLFFCSSMFCFRKLYPFAFLMSHVFQK